MQQIALSIETTGLSHKEGHRIVEIAAIELHDRKITQNYFHRYFNPERECDLGTTAVHGLTLTRLQSEAKFAAVSSELLAFISGAELVAHNSQSYIGFLNAELKLAGFPPLNNPVIDTLEIAKTLHFGMRNNLLALCERYHIKTSDRHSYGALLEAELLVEVYFSMTRQVINPA